MFSDLFSSLDGCWSMKMWVPPMIIMLTMISFSWSQSTSTSFKWMIFSMWSSRCSFSTSLMYLILPSLMTLLIYINLAGLTPLTFCVTTSLWVNSSIALLIWLCLVLSGWTWSFKKSVAHLTPAGAPIILIPFLILIETISIMIRPLTLTVRLVANMSAGHIVMSLIASSLSTVMSLLPLMMIFMVMIGYNLFEIFVCFIQAYIFTLLLSLYKEEHPSKSIMM